MKDVARDPRTFGVFAFDAAINEYGDLKFFDFNTGPNFKAFTRGNKILQL